MTRGNASLQWSPAVIHHCNGHQQWVMFEERQYTCQVASASWPLWWSWSTFWYIHFILTALVYIGYWYWSLYWLLVLTISFQLYWCLNIVDGRSTLWLTWPTFHGRAKKHLSTWIFVNQQLWGSNNCVNIKENLKKILKKSCQRRRAAVGVK